MSTARTRRTTSALLVVLGGFLAVPAPAQADPTCRPAPYTARSDAALLRLGLLDLRPLGLGLPPLLNAELATAHSEANSTRPVATSAEAQYANAQLLGLSVPLPNAVAQQSAPPDNHQPAKAIVQALNAGGLVTAKVGESTASARWKDGYGCGLVARLSEASTSVASAKVFGGVTPGLPVLQTVSSLLGGPLQATPLLQANSVVSARTNTETVRLDSGKTGVAATAAAGIADINLLNQISVKVLHQPTLTVVSGGTKADATVRYDAPLLEVRLPGGQVQRLDTPKASVGTSICTRALLSAADASRSDRRCAPLQVQLSLGELTSVIDDRGAVRAEAATLRVRMALAGATVADIGVGLLSASAAAPRANGNPTPTPTATSPTGKPQPSATVPQPDPSSSSTPPGTPGGKGSSGLPVTGVKLVGYATGGLALLFGGLLLFRLNRARRSSFEA